VARREVRPSRQRFSRFQSDESPIRSLPLRHSSPNQPSVWRIEQAYIACRNTRASMHSDSEFLKNTCLFERERRHQVPADLGRRRLRDDGRRHADLHVLLRTAVRAGGHGAGKARHSSRTSSTRCIPARQGLPLLACPATPPRRRDGPGRHDRCPGSFTYNGAVGQVPDLDNGGASMATWIPARSWMSA
jgi:hypothetical protein